MTGWTIRAHWMPEYQGHHLVMVVYFHGKPRPWELGKGHWAHG